MSSTKPETPDDVVGATSEVVRSIAQLLDSLTRATEETGFQLEGAIASCDTEGVTIRVRWSADDEAYVAEVR